MSAPILSHKIDLDRLTEATLKPPIAVTATPAQCAALATQFGILGITSLSGNFKLRRDRDGIVHASLDLKAKVTQSCVVTLEPVDQSVAERAPLVFLTRAQAHSRAHLRIDPDAPDDIVADGAMIDLGAVLAEQLALALDPYPRCGNP